MPLWVFLAGGAAALLSLGLVLSCWRRCSLRKRSLRHSPEKAIVHSEHHASGYSHRSLITQLGGVARQVELTVTDDRLLVDVAYPFALVAEQVDLCHRIALDSIERVAARRVPHGLECIITFRNQRGASQQLSLFPESPDRFLRALHAPAPEFLN
ncbi:MAG: hypothetical protein QM691_09605 [Opitutaceae bacterium]